MSAWIYFAASGRVHRRVSRVLRAYASMCHHIHIIFFGVIYLSGGTRVYASFGNTITRVRANLKDSYRQRLINTRISRYANMLMFQRFILKCERRCENAYENSARKTEVQCLSRTQNYRENSRGNYMKRFIWLTLCVGVRLTTRAEETIILDITQTMSLSPQTT